ncbi:uncharacterized protein LOC21400717 isoform X2 [Morus notabilis]|uniref:uncharacterized protein LOC21400717 isoform X2 n=1 Tax=Morus notabilis TaxID=981085 RepID=UPI000CED4DC2|nr:uncharacterized protein LOC21400717 isoform X2 [Morus notabilis]
MDLPLDGEGLAILQLQKWGPSHPKLNLSEFREAFISPTRQLLLLLSCQYEALLLPLLTDCTGTPEVENCSTGSVHHPYSASDSRQDDMPCTSGSELYIDNDFSFENETRSKRYPFVGDVNSVAWGVCGDTYNHHKNSLFREFLFVSGNHGVTVHAFCKPNRNAAISGSALESEFEQGGWVQWGPSVTLIKNKEDEEPSSSRHETNRNVEDVNVAHGNSEMRNHELSRGIDSKVWFQSFFTKVEEIESDGKRWTIFPEKSSFPCSAKVVSFPILHNNLPFMDFLPESNSFVNKECLKKMVHDSEGDTCANLTLPGPNFELDILSTSFGVGMNSLYKCSRVFSSNSHNCVGFALTLKDPLFVHKSDEERSVCKNVVLISRLDSVGIHWVSLVKLGENQNIGPLVEWADFHFCGDLLVSLNSSGFIVFHSAMSGDYVAHLDILQNCGLKPQLNLWKQDKDERTKVQKFLGGSEYQYDKSFGSRVFNRLIVASHTSLLAAVDECGVVYVISAGHCLVNEGHKYEKLLPDFQDLGLGMLAGWVVGGSDIGCQRVYCKFSGSQNYMFSFMRQGYLSFLDDDGNNALQKIQDWNLQGKGRQNAPWLSGFSAASEITNQTCHECELKSHLMRRIFLPNYRVNADDSICFSPFGITRLIRKHNTKDQKGTQIGHFNLHAESAIRDESCLSTECEMFLLEGRNEAFVGDAVGCTFQGCFYLVTDSGLSLVLPSVSVSSSFLPIESIGYRQWGINSGIGYQVKDNLEMRESKRPCSPWILEVLDRVLLYEGVEEAERLCFENGWDLKICRMRRLQLALDYLKYDDIEQCLEMLVGVNLAEEGILRLLFAAVYLMLNVGNDNDVSAASRLLALATCFATKMIRKYGLLQHDNDVYVSPSFGGTEVHPFPPVLPDKLPKEVGVSRRLSEMAHFLEIIRNLQSRLSMKSKRPAQGLVDEGDESRLVASDFSQDESKLSIDPLSLEMINQNDSSLPVSAEGSNYAENVALTPIDPKAQFEAENLHEVSLEPGEGLLEKKILSLENPKEMIARWKIDNLDLKTVVNDALLSGRLPLAVLQLHLHHSRDLIAEGEPHDIFNEVRDIGRAIAYDLFLKGETGLAVATLQRLGEDVETSLKQLLFGTVRRSLRAQIFEEMKRYGYLGPHEWKIMDKMSLIESLYTSSSFWRTFIGRQKEYARVPASSQSARRNYLCLLLSNVFNNFIIECGEIDGVVLGSWTNINENPPVPVVDDDNVLAGYWAAAAVWCNVWDQRTIDRIVLEQSSVMDVNVLWESKLDYYMGHGDWEEVSKLLDLIPESSVVDRSLQISLDSLQPASTVGCLESSRCGNYICSLEELDAVCMDVPNIKILRLPPNTLSSTWLKMHMEEKLGRKLIFLKEYWEGTEEIVPLLARSGFIISRYKILIDDEFVGSLPDLKFSDGGAFGIDTVQALHRVLVHHCVECNLPYLLDLYLDQHKLVLDNGSLSSLQDAAGDCEWAKWLLLSRVKGREYDASFSNARSATSRGLVPATNLGVLVMDEIIRTVDDIAEGGGELAALATLMYAPAPIQNCLSSGGVKRHINSSAQCTLENLKPTLQSFPTLWRTFVSACFGQDTTFSFLDHRAKNVLSDYLNWRDNIFFSSGHDTSLLQMLPCWFPKALRRLVQLYVQGPLGWQSISGMPPGETLRHREIDFFINVDEHAEINAISWEATIQKHIEEELYDPTLEETGLGLEHHLHRGRALSAFNRLLSIRVQKLKLEGQSVESTNGQTNIQSDLLRLLAPLTETEGSLLSSVMPLAIMHFEDPVLVASCAFVLELCGLSASMLRVDVAALRRISSYYKSTENNDDQRQFSPKGSAFHAVSHERDIVESLARALADHYLHQDSASSTKKKKTPSLVTGQQSSRALIHVLHHLEKASLPLTVDGNTCGSWLLSGNGDGIDLRSQQKAASQHWNLVTVFCQMHHLPLSTKYLDVLARDNDWVGFLSEAQLGGYSFDAVIQVASKEFSDPRLKTHILTVLKSMQSRKKASTSSYPDNSEKRTEISFSDEQTCYPVELFRILAECEKQKNPGEALLKKAKDLSWSILAMIASCFSDVSPLSCLTVWLEITAARETSSIKVNDIASQVADNVGAAVEATNSLPAGSRFLTFHYNRRNPKRRRILESIPGDLSDVEVTSISTSPVGEKVFVAQGFMVEEERKIELSDSDEGHVSLSKMVAVLCEQHLFLPLLRAFEMFLPSCSLLPFIRALQAFSQMRLSEAAAHLGSFSARIKEEPSQLQANIGREGQIGISWISSMAVKAADATLLACPSPYEKRCLLQLLAATDFGDGGSTATDYRRLSWKINLAEPSLRKDDLLQLGNETLDDASLLEALEKNGHWEQARNWAKQLETSGGPWKSAFHHVTETQAESMVAEWKEFLWDVPEERVALWSHCQTLFIRYSFPALQAGLFFLKHAEAAEKDLPARELHELLLLSLQWLSGMITLMNPVYPLNLLREIETRVWLLAVESEAQVKSDGEFNIGSMRDPINKNSSSIIDHTASIIAKMDNHINSRSRNTEKQDARENNQVHYKNQSDVSFSTIVGGPTKTKRRAKGYGVVRRTLLDPVDRSVESDEVPSSLYYKNDMSVQDENVRTGMSFSRWEERVGPAELERAVLSLLEFSQISAAKQLQYKLSPAQVPSEFVLVDAALKLAALSTPNELVYASMLDEEVQSVMQSHNILTDQYQIQPLQVLESLATIFTEGRGRGLCKRIIAVVKAANVLGLSFPEAFDKQPIELLQLLSLKAQESFEEANLLVQTHSMPAANIAQILAESFLKGLLAAHRGGYMDSQKEEGPAPLLWRFSDFLKWAELCPSEPEIGHALMRMVITGQEIPHACEVELLILSHHFYKSSACLDGVDVLVALAATRVDAYVSEGDFACLARLITGVGNFHALNFILGILIENGQLDLLLQKYSAAADTNTGTAEAVRGFRMAVLTSLKHFNPNDLDAFAMVYNHFDMKHETAALLESRADQSSEQWFGRRDRDQNEDLLDAMRYFIEAAEVHSSIDAGNKTRRACAQASLLSLQIRMPDIQWLYLSETNARRALVEQSRFQEALIVAEAYGLNQPSEWALVLWNQMLKPELLEEFVAEFVAVLPLQSSMLIDLARFYRAEVAARGDQSQFSVWLTGGGLPAEWAKYLGRSFRCLLRRTRDLRLQLQLATLATGFNDVINTCNKVLDKVPENAGPLVLRKGHGGAYLPLM